MRSIRYRQGTRKWKKHRTREWYISQYGKSGNRRYER